MSICCESSSPDCRFPHESSPPGSSTMKFRSPLCLAGNPNNSSPTTYGIPSPSSVDSSIHSSVFPSDSSLTEMISRSGNSYGSHSMYSQPSSPPIVREELLPSSLDTSNANDMSPSFGGRAFSDPEEEWSASAGPAANMGGFLPRRRSAPRDQVTMMRQLQQEHHQQQMLFHQQQIDRRVCFSFRETGFCKYGENCRFLHISPTTALLPPDMRSARFNRMPAVRSAAPFKKFNHVCFYYRDSGRCPYGVECRYIHEEPPMSQQQSTNRDAYIPEGDDPQLLDEYMMRLDIQTHQPQPRLGHSSMNGPRDAYFNRPQGLAPRFMNQMGVKKGVCFEFRDTGTCKFGSSCRFVHEYISPGPANNSSNGQSCLPPHPGSGVGMHMSDGMINSLSSDAQFLERQTINILNEDQ